jgi:hypothetical protein
MKTSELTGAQLDWVVAKCEGGDEFCFNPLPYLPDENGQPSYFMPSTDWSQGGPIIEREGLALDLYADYPRWKSSDAYGHAEYGPTPLIAAMRVYAAFKLGDDVGIPEELL